jgi:glycosyltransferase involved in cell wall biosynthesis
LRIAQVAPLYESVPPRRYGGTERVVSFLTEELVRQGHEVTLYATADSMTSARLVSPWPEGLRLSDVRDPLACHVLLTEMAMSHADSFDVMHFHHDHHHLPYLRSSPVPMLATAHGRLDLPELAPLFRRFDRAPMISISDAQRAPLRWLNWQATIYHGLPRDLLRFSPGPGRYLAFLGRLSPEKGADRAIEIAVRSGMPLRIAAKIEPFVEPDYVASVSRWFDHPLVEYVGEIGDEEKQELLGNAAALLMPGDWPEPFGIAIIEALA